jgi:sulfite exporter TauE/SafE
MTGRGGSAGGNAASRAADAGERLSDSAEDAGQQAMASKPFRILLTVGLVAYGVVHVLVGWIALQLAWSGLTGGDNQEASQQGALAEVASKPFGAVALWIIAVGLFALVIWQVVEAIWGHRDRPQGFKRVRKRLGSAGRAIAYAVVGAAAVRTATGSSGSSGNKEEGWTARLLALPFGRILVVAVGITIIVLGVRLVRRGVKKKFTEDLVGGISQGVVRLGQIGYIVKGIAYAIVGCLFGWAAITYDADKAGGLDEALRTVNGAPFGSALLTLMALGLICFGIYCFVWARYPRVSTSGSAAGRR